MNEYIKRDDDRIRIENERLRLEHLERTRIYETQLIQASNALYYGSVGGKIDLPTTLTLTFDLLEKKSKTMVVYDSFERPRICKLRNF